MPKPEHTSPTGRVAFAPETKRRPGRLILRILDEDPPHDVTIDGQVVTVGRSSLADVCVEQRSVSGVHFELRPTAGGATLRDLGSTNGVWFHDRRVPEVELEAGDMFRAGKCRFALLDVLEVEFEVLDIDHYGQLHGSSLAMRELYRQIDKLAPTPLDILLLGETGTGKERTARTIHQVSRRRGPLVVLDCGALSRTLAEGTIFGFRKGAFTGADRDQAGVFEAADGGTLFIDEVGELALEHQVKLLRALDNREVTRLGEPGKARKVEVRVIAATHRDLRQAVVEGSFRQDLYYRLARAVLRTPPLRERGEDIVELAQTFLNRLCREYGVEVQLAEDAAESLRAHTWPGNVRELRNVVEHAAHLRGQGELVAGDLYLGDARLPGRGRIEDICDGSRSYDQVHAAVDELLLLQVLEVNGRNLTQAAKQIGISRDRFRIRLKQLGLYTSD